MKNKTSVREITQIKWENALLVFFMFLFGTLSTLNLIIGDVAFLKFEAFIVAFCLFVIVSVSDAFYNLTEKFKFVVQDDDKK